MACTITYKGRQFDQATFESMLRGFSPQFAGASQSSYSRLSTKESVSHVADKLSEIFGVEYEIVDDMTQGWKGRVDVKNNKVQINVAFATEDTPFHEYSHIFNAVIRKNYPELWKKIKAEVPSREIQRAKNQGLTGEDVYDEAVANTLGKLAANKKVKKSFIEAIRDAWRAVRKALKEFFGVGVDISFDSTLQQVADLMSEGSPEFMKRSLEQKYGKTIRPAKLDNLRIEIAEYNRRMGARWLDVYQTTKGNWKIKANPVLHSPLDKLETFTDQEYLYQLDESTKRFYTHQFRTRSLSPVQKKIAEQIIELQSDVQLNDDGSGYTYRGRVPFKRVSRILQDDDYYAFHGDDTQYEENRQWGNAVDHVLERVILGDTVDEIAESLTNEGYGDLLSGTALQQLYDEFVKLNAQYNDSVIMTQMVLYNVKEGVAGTADVIIVQPDGSILIHDLKSSIHPTSRDYQSESGFTNNYTKRFRSGGQTYASKSDRHQAQLSIYGSLAKAMNLSLDVEGLGIIPIHLDVVDGVIQEIQMEPFISHDKLNKWKNLEVDNTTDEVYDPFARLIIKMKKLLGEQIQQQKRNNKNPYFTEQLVAVLNDTDSLNAINNFVLDAYETFFGNPGRNFSGWYNIFNDILENKDSEPDKLKILNRLNYVHSLIETYNSDEVLSELRTILRNNPVFGDDSVLSKVRDVIEVVDEMRQKYQDQIPGVMAEILAKQVSPDKVAAMESRITQMENKIAELKTSKAKEYRIKRLERKLAEEKERLYYDESGVDVKRMIEEEIKVGGYKDINQIDRLFTPPVSIDSSYLSTFALTLKNAFEKVRLQIIQNVKESRKEFDKFRKATGRKMDLPHKFNEGMYKTRRVRTQEVDEDGNRIWKEVLTLVSPIDYGTFDAAKDAMYRQSEEIENERQAREFRNTWWLNNTESRPLEDVKINGVTVIEGRQTILARKQKQMSKSQFENWKKSQTKQHRGRTIYIKELSIPKRDKYTDAQFEKIMSNPAMRDYYLFLVKKYFKSQEVLPERYDEGEKWILPFIQKSWTDRVLEEHGSGIFSGLTYEGVDSIFSIDKDYQEEQLQDSVKSIPVLYFNRSHMMEHQDVSKDLLLSIQKFEAAALRFEQQNRHAVLADNLLSVVKNTAPALQDTNGYKILSKAASLVGIEEGVEKYAKKHGNNVAAMLEAFIDTQIYGRYRKDSKVKVPRISVLGREILSGEIDVGKVADTLIRFASRTQIAFNPFVAVANSLQAQTMNMIESWAFENFTPKTWARARAEYLKNEGQFLQDSFSPYSKTLIGQLVDAYDALQGEYYSNYGDRLSKSAAKQKLSWSSAYAAQHKGEHLAQVTAMIASMMEKQVTRVVDGIEKQIPLYEAYSLDDNGDLTLKSGVQLDGLVDTDLQNRLHAMNKRLHGVYNSFDKVEAERYALGRLVLMYRKFLVPGWKKRFKREGFDWEYGNYTEGTYRTFYRALFNETKELFNYLVRNEHNLTSLEKQNINRAIAEHLIIMLTGLAVYALSAAFDTDDEDEKRMYGYMLYFAMRLNTEMSIYGAPGDPTFYGLPNFREMWAIHRSPTIGFTVIQKAMNFYYHGMAYLFDTISGEEVDRYKRDTGIFKKGDSKAYAAFIKLFGLNSKAYDPESAINALVLSKGATRQ